MKVHISIPMDFGERQPRLLHEAPAIARPLQAGTFIGSVEQGGSCNVDTVTMVAHCHGTHTETAYHIYSGGPRISDIEPVEKSPCQLISVHPTLRSCPIRNGANMMLSVVDANSVRLALKSCDAIESLVIRTLPNDISKCSRRYEWDEDFPFISEAAMQVIRAKGVRHLVIDTPSVDRCHSCEMPAHRLFFGSTDDPDFRRRTITEFAFIPNDVADGHYYLSIAFPRWYLDAAPSWASLQSGSLYP